MSYRHNILVHLGCYNKNIIDWVAFKQQKFICHCPGGCKSDIRVPEWSGENPLPGQRLLLVSSHGGRGKGAFLATFTRALIPFPLIPPNHLPKVPPPTTITLGIRFQHMNLGDTNIQPTEISQGLLGHLK